MTDEQFCKIESALTGESIDKVEQLVSRTFTGRELKEYLEEAFALYSINQQSKQLSCIGCKYNGGDDSLCGECGDDYSNYTA